MNRTVQAVAIMLLGPPIIYFASANAMAWSSWSLPRWFEAATFVAALAVGLAAVANSGWHKGVKWGVAGAYTAAAVPTFGFVGLLASCSVGNCL